MNRPLTERRPDEPGPSGPAGSPHWPRVPEPPEAMLRALLLQWDRTQWLPPEDLRTHQLKQAARLLGHALQSVPYQQERLARAGLALDQELTWPLWRRIPVVTRARLKAAGNSIRATRLPTDHGAPAGAGPIQQTAVTRLFRNAVALRDHRWQRRDLSATLAAIVADHSGSAAFPEGRRAASWGPFADQGFPTGPAMFLAADTPIDLQLLWLRQVTPRYLAADRRTIEALARRTLERPGDGASVEGLILTSPVIPSSTRELCRRAWDAPVSGMFALPEVGIVVLGCPGHHHFLAQSETVLCEVLDDDGAPCPSGRNGRLVVTALHNFATPVLRLDTGLRGRWGGPCPTGRGLPVLRIGTG